MKPEDNDRLFCKLAVELGFLEQAYVDQLFLQHGGDPGAVWLALAGSGRLTPSQLETLGRVVATPGARASMELAPTMAESGRSLRRASPDQTTLSEAGTATPNRTLQSPDDGVVSPDDAMVTEESEGRYTPGSDDGTEREIGQGGIGRVLVVRDLHLGRSIAMKELLRPARPRVEHDRAGGEARATVEDMTVARFLREARVTGALEHPNIVPVYELGMRRDGTLYYTMRHVRGRTLSEALAQCESLSERLALLTHFGSLCHAIAYAHSRGVIHRDIKPANVMIGEFGETVVLDWGLAKVPGRQDVRGAEIEHDAQRLRNVAAGLTMDGSLMGTPSYMSPEQAAGRIDRVDERTDVWALGVVLYQILTGDLPFRGDTVAALVSKVRAGEVANPVLRDDRIPADLASVCMKALERAPEARYVSARELAREIDAYQTGEKVAAHEYTSWEHLRRFASKNRALLGALAVTLVAIMAALAATGWFYAREKSARVSAQQAAQREQQALEKERRERLLADYHIAQGFHEKATRLARDKSSLAAGLYAAASLVHNPASDGPSHDAGFAASSPDSVTLRLRAVSRAWQSSVSHQLAFDRCLDAGQKPVAVAYSPDGKAVAAAGDNRRIRVWDAHTGAELATLTGHAGRINAIAFTPDGTRIASCADDGEVRIADARSGTLSASWRIKGGAALDLAVSPSTSEVAIASHDGDVELWSIDSAKRTGLLHGHDTSVHALAYSGDGRRMATASRDKTVRIWDVASRTTRRTLVGHTAVVRGVALSRDGALVASASYDRTIRVWDTETGAIRFVGDGFDDEVLSVAFSPDGSTVASASWDRSIRIWDVRSGTVLENVEGHTAAIWKAVFSPDGLQLASVGDDKRLRLWRTVPGRPVLAGDGQGYIWAVRYLPDGRSVVVAGADGALRIWDAVAGTVRARLSGHTDLVADLALSRDGRTLLSAGYDRTARLWDIPGAREIRAFTGHETFVRAVAFSPDSAIAATASHDGQVVLWDTATGQSRVHVDTHAGPVRQVVFAPDGSWLAAALDDGSVGMWDTATGHERGRLRSVGENASALAFTADGARLASAGSAGVVTVWDLVTRQAWRSMRWHDQSVYSIRFSPDGKRLATAGDDRTIALWNMGSEAPFLLVEAGQSVMAAEYSPDGQTLAYGDGAAVRLVPAVFDPSEHTPQQMLEAAERAAGMRLEGFELRQTE